jgi:hypothetical protein
MSAHAQRKIVVGIIFLVLLAVNVFLCVGRPRFGIEDQAKTKFASLPGKISIGFLTEKRDWSCSINKGDLAMGASRLTGPKEANIGTCERIYDNTEFSQQLSLPEFQGVIYRGPFLVSPDKSLIVVGIEHERSNLMFPTDFVVIDFKKKEIIFQRNLRKVQCVDVIAWSPDSKYFAIAQSTERPFFCILSILAYMVGHPARTQTYSLLVYDRFGNLYVQSKIASGFNGSVDLVWE